MHRLARLCLATRSRLSSAESTRSLAATLRRDDAAVEGRRELTRNVVRLSCESVADGGVCDVYLVGTNHVSQDSRREVKAIVSFLKPQIPATAEMIDMWKKKEYSLFKIFLVWITAKVATKREVLPGAEFRVAYEEARKYGAKVILGDRPEQITDRRTWAKMPLWHKTKFVFCILYEYAEFLFVPSALKKMRAEENGIFLMESTLTVQKMSKKFPTLMETILHERDRYMSCMLLRVAKKHSSVVAVVGRGHLKGIKKNWEQPVSQEELKELMEIPVQKQGVYVGNMCSVAVAGVAIISGIYFKFKR